MQNIDDYINVMIESLQKKRDLLDRIIVKNKAQSECILGKEYDDIDWEAFDLLISEKEILIDRINEMDEGFQNLFDHVKIQLEANKNMYSAEIKTMQVLIKQVTDRSVEIRTGEERNRASIDKIMSGKKHEIRQLKNGLKVANSYQQAMQRSYYGNDSVLNTKK